MNCRPLEGRTAMRMIIVLAAIVLAAGVAVARLVDRAGHADVASSAISTPAAASANPSNSRTVELSRGNGGHFWTDARIDGRRLELVVDTGASQVALRAGDAARLGI